jgi:hypothetical protein
VVEEKSPEQRSAMTKANPVVAPKHGIKVQWVSSVLLLRHDEAARGVRRLTRYASAEMAGRTLTEDSENQTSGSISSPVPIMVRGGY